MANEILKNKAKNAGVRHWQIAEEIGIRPNDFSVLLRHELSSEIFKKACAAIDKLKKENNDH